MAQLRYSLELSGHGVVEVQLELRSHGAVELQFGTERSWHN